MTDNRIARQSRLLANVARLDNQDLVADALTEAAEEIDRLEKLGDDNWRYKMRIRVLEDQLESITRENNRIRATMDGQARICAKLVARARAASARLGRELHEATKRDGDDQ